MRTCRIYALARFFLGILVFDGFVSSALYANSEDVGREKIYRLQDYTNDDAKIFYAKKQNPYSGTGSTFTQNYKNGTLVFGNDKKEQNNNRDDGVHFGQGGWTGYVTGTFNAKEVFLTSHLGAGNNTGAGAGATLTFNTTENITAQGLNLDMWSNTQGDTLTLNAQGNVTINNSTFKIKGSNSNLNITAKGSLNADGFTLSMPANSESVNAHFTAGEISFKNSNLDIVSNGVSWIGTTKFQADKNITFDDKTTANFRASHFEMKAGENITLNGTINMQSGSNLADAYILFDAGKNLSLNTLNATLHSGKGQFIAKAGENLSIQNLTLHGNVGTAVNKTYATFEAGKININKAEIYSTRGISNATDNAGAFVVKFIAKDSITLKDTNIKLTNQLEGVGSADYAVFESGGDLTHTGKLSTATAQQTWGGATFDFSKVKGKASVGDMEIVAANVRMNSDFTAKSLVVQKRQTNGGQDSLGTKLWAQESGKYKFDSIRLDSGTDLAADTARMTFVNSDGGNAFVKDSKLELGSLSVGVKGGFYASNIHHTTATNITLHSNSTASFHNLTLTPGGQITMDATNAQLVLDNQLVNGKDEAGVLELGVSMKDYANNVNGYGKPLLAITNAGDQFQNLNIQAGEVKRLIDAGEIKYNFVDSTGKQQMIHCDGSAKEQCAQIEKLIAIYEGEKPADNGNYTQGRIDLSAMGLKYEKVLTYNYIGLKISSNNANNPYDISDIRYYLYEKCGQSCIDEIGAVSNSMDKILVSQTQTGSDTKGEAQTLYVYEYQKDGKTEKVFCSSHDTAQCAKDNNLDSSTQLTQSSVTHTESDVFDWFNYLAITHHGITWTGANILLYGEEFFLQSANQLNDTLDQLSSVDRKSSASASTRLAADIARANRLVKLSNHTIDMSNQAFARLIARTPHYADSGTIASDTSHKINPAFLYKFSNRHEFMNNIWATAIGSASFVKNGHGTLYGINTGYDRFIPVGESGVIIGAQVSYGYGTYSADLLKNNSHNVNTGIYTRTFIQNHEVDLTANYTIGINTEDIYTRQNVWLSALDQSYGYNTHTAMIHANYGYVFGTNNKSLVFKPMGGLSYYHISVGEINGLKTALESNAAIQAPQTSRDLLALNLALEMRQYFSGASYYFINVGAQKDLYISKGTIENVRFAGDNSLSYRASDGLNTHVLATAGGEVLLGKQTFINFALGGKAGLSYKDLNLTANLGVRYVF